MVTLLYAEGMSTEAEWITLTEAARRAGYRGSQALGKAAREGKLKTITPSSRMRLTTQAWLNEYLAAIRHPNTSRRGQERKGQDAGDGAGE